MEFDKVYWRKTIKKEILRLQKEITSEQEEDFFEEIEMLEVWKGAKTVALYCSLSDEISTSRVIAKWSESKRVVLPVVLGDEMEFYDYTDGCELCRGSYGILEPSRDSIVDPDSIDLIVVPGVAFDLRGYRLGRGKGYYDKYLPKTSAYKIGVALSCQVVDLLPTEKHDVQMDLIVTDKSDCRIAKK